MNEIMRDVSHNHGMIVDLNIPTDRFIVAGIVVLMDDDGEFSTFVTQKRAAFGFKASPRPNDEVLLELSALIAQAWQLASLTALEGNE